MLKLTNICRVFHTDEVETTALNDISLEVKRGEFVSIMGPSGCGKSTLLNILGLLDNPTSGQYLFQGQDVTHYSERQRAGLRKKHIGFIFQSFNLIDELTVACNVELALTYQGVPASERPQRVKDVLEKMSIGHRANHFPKQLSGGQQQRVAIARVLVSQPLLILADEPTGNLDTKQGKVVMETLQELNERGTTVVMVTHSYAQAGCGKRVINILDGNIVEPPPAEVAIKLQPVTD